MDSGADRGDPGTESWDGGENLSLKVLSRSASEENVRKFNEEEGSDDV